MLNILVLEQTAHLLFGLHNSSSKISEPLERILACTRHITLALLQALTINSSDNAKPLSQIPRSRKWLHVTLLYRDSPNYFVTGGWERIMYKWPLTKGHLSSRVTIGTFIKNVVFNSHVIQRSSGNFGIQSTRASLLMLNRTPPELNLRSTVPHLRTFRSSSLIGIVMIWTSWTHVRWLWQQITPSDSVSVKNLETEKHARGWKKLSLLPIILYYAVIHARDLCSLFLFSFNFNRSIVLCIKFASSTIHASLALSSVRACISNRGQPVAEKALSKPGLRDNVFRDCGECGVHSTLILTNPHFVKAKRYPLAFGTNIECIEWRLWLAEKTMSWLLGCFLWTE